MKWIIIAILISLIIINIIGVKYAKSDIEVWKFAPKSPQFDFSVSESAFYPNASLIADLPTIPPILARIAECESGNKQYNPDGSLLRGKINPNDVGYFQISEVYHLKTAKSMNIDIYSENGNIKYALYLFKKNGTRDWEASRKMCWGK